MLLRRIRAGRAQMCSQVALLSLISPKVDDWKDFTTIRWRQAFQLTPTGGKQVIGAATFTATTNVDTEKHMVALYGIQVTNTYFPSLDPLSKCLREKSEIIRPKPESPL